MVSIATFFSLNWIHSKIISGATLICVSHSFRAQEALNEDF